MSEEADNKAPADPDDTSSPAERRKRRRKWSGLRVPSDNVPRKASNTKDDDSEPVAVPSHEDPHLAVSVAYAFGGGEEPAEQQESAAPEEAGAAPEPDEPIPTTVDEDAWVDSGPTTERAQPSVPVSDLVDDEEDETGDSVDIAFDDEDFAEQTLEVGQASERAATEALSEEDLEELHVDPAATRAERTKPNGLAAAGPAPRPPSAANAGAAAAATPPAPTATPAEDLPRAEQPTQPLGIVVSGRVSLDSVAERAAPAAAAPAKPPPMGVPAAVAALERSVIDSPTGPKVRRELDPGESGEILPDDLVEEIAEPDEVSDEVPAAQETAAPPSHRRLPTEPPPPPLAPKADAQKPLAAEAAPDAQPVGSISEAPSHAAEAGVEPGGVDTAPAAPPAEPGATEDSAAAPAEPEAPPAKPAASATPATTDVDPDASTQLETAPAATGQETSPPEPTAESAPARSVAKPDAAPPPPKQEATPPPPPPPEAAATQTGSEATPPPPPTQEDGQASAAVKKPPPPPKTAGQKGPQNSAARAAAVAAAASPQRPRRRKGKPWFEEIFEEDYLRTLPFLTPQATQAEAEFVCSSLELQPGSQILDLGCGYGRHAMEMAARGYHVVALDSSLPLLLRGADEAQRRGLDINFVHGDMRELTFDAQFDGAYCLFSTFGYFDDETNKLTAMNIARALKPDGRFVVEVLNRDYLISDLPSRVWWEGDGCVVLEEVEFNYFSSRVVSNRSVVFDDGRQLEQEISLRAYSLHEFGKLLHAAGFRVLEISGSNVTRGRFFGNQSREIIVLAERRSGSGDNDG